MNCATRFIRDGANNRSQGHAKYFSDGATNRSQEHTKYFSGGATNLSQGHTKYFSDGDTNRSQGHTKYFWDGTTNCSQGVKDTLNISGMAPLTVPRDSLNTVFQGMTPEKISRDADFQW